MTAEQQLPASALLQDVKDRPLLLDIVVTDKSGNPIAGLQQQDFTVLDNKRQSKILSFHAQNSVDLTSAPDIETEIFLVLDEVNTTFQKVSYERDSVKKYLLQNNGKLSHPVSLAFFSDAGLQIQTQSTLDGNALAAALDQQKQSLRNIGSGTGTYGAEDRLKLSLDALNSLTAQEQTRPGKKMVIWISPGWPLLSGPRTSLSSAQMGRVFDSVVRLSAAFRKARITLYSIDPLGAAGTGARTVFYQNFTKGLTNPGHAEIGDLGLQVLATQSGGRAIFGNDTIVNSIDHCAADLNAQYVVSIDTPPAERASEYHGLEIRLGTPGLIARASTGYYEHP